MNLQPTSQLQENIFAFENPDEMSNELWYFARGHRMLGMKTGHTHEDAPIIKINFTGVEYFSGLTTWTGANIRLHSNQEGLTFIQQNLPRQWQDYQELEKMNRTQVFNYKLYSIPTKEGCLIQIVAANVYIHSGDSPF